MQKETIHLGSAEKNAVESCLSIIRGCQLPDGAFCMMQEAPGVDVWIPPYFANHAALALLAAYRWKKDPADLNRVKDWLAWCARHQAKEGYLPDFQGKPESYRITERVVDAWDSSAALFLLAVGQYYSAGGKVTGPMVTAAKKALGCIQAVTDTDGVTWAKPDYRIKYLEDNIEVYAGLIQAAGFFQKIKNVPKAAEAKSQAERIGKKLPRFWNAEKKRYAVAMQARDILDDVLKSENQAAQKLEAYPQGQVQLFGIAFVKPQQGALETARSFPVDDIDRQSPFGSERWLIATARIGGAEAKQWRQRTTQAALKFTPSTVYIMRPALVVLGLLEGADWMPAIASAPR